MTTSRIALALGLLGCGSLVFPAAAHAQGFRVTVEPRVSGLPGATIWQGSASRTFTTEPTVPAADQPPPSITNTRDVKLSRPALAIVGARVTLAPAGGAWRLALDGAAGSGTMRADIDEEQLYQGGWEQVVGGRHFGNRDLPLAVAQVGAHVERGMRMRRAAIELGGGAMAQRIRTRTMSLLPPTPSQGGYSSDVRYAYRTVIDPALQVSAAVGPSTGVLSGLRLALRSTHVWRDGRLANEYGTAPSFQVPDARPQLRGRRWQWQPELSLGWRVGP
jgi:hypothetical protein